MKKNLLLALFAVMIIPATCHAGGAGLGVEDTLTKILKTLDGPVAYFIGIGSIIIAGAGWASSENGSSTRQGFKIAVALSVMFNAVTIASTLWNRSSGLGL